jgi:molybdopterin-containing oxidoreductase family membrane subunit
MNRRLAFGAWIAALLAIIGVGFFAWLRQLQEGLILTGLNNVVSWGFYIVAFMFLVGLSAGGLIVVAGAQLAGTHQFRPLSKLAVLTSGVCIILAAGFILPDLGHPERILNVLTSGQFFSPLVWDVIAIAIYLAIAIVDLWLLSRPRESEKALNVMALVALPAAVLVHSITAWIFGLLVARPFWNTPLLAPMFISSALVSGLGLLLLVTLAARRFGGFRVENTVLTSLGKLMAWFVGVDLFFLFAEALTTFTSGSPEHVRQLNLLVRGPLAPLFWSEVLLGGSVPFLIFAIPTLRRSPALIGLGSAFAVGAILFKRINILLSSMMDPLLQLSPGLPLGRPAPAQTPVWSTIGRYAPTGFEWAIGLGIFAFGAFLLTLGIRYLVLPSRLPTMAGGSE